MTTVVDLLGIVAIIAIVTLPFASLFVALRGWIKPWVFLQCFFLVSAFGLAEIQNSGRGSFVLIVFAFAVLLAVCIASAAAAVLGNYLRRRAATRALVSRESIQ